MNKFCLTKLVILLAVLATSCGFKRNSFENYQSTINETLNPQSSNLKEVQNIYDVKDVRGCGMDIELGVWSKNERLSSADKEVWSRRGANYDHGIIGSGNDYIDFRKQDSTPNLTTNKNIHIVYIGPWRYAKRVGKEIRFVAYTGRGGGAIFNQFESKNSQNELIPAREFYLNPKLHNIRDRTSLCTAKWIANHGYNAISKVKSKNPFSQNYMVPTGEIVEVGE